jgi:integrase/recombinase XerC
MRYQMNKNKYLLNPEIDALEYLLNRHLESDLRNCLIIFMALKTGARAQEILNVTHSDVNNYDQTVFIRGIKGSNDREIPIHPNLFKKLNLYLVKNPGASSSKIFDITYPRLYQVWDLYRPCAKKFHSLRHTFAIQLYQKTRDIRLVQVALGHRNIANTMVYADYVYSKQELKKLIL